MHQATNTAALLELCDCAELFVSRAWMRAASQDSTAQPHEDVPSDACLPNGEVHDGAQRAEAAARVCALAGIAAIDVESRELVEREVLTPGMPLAALPVESLYKPWASARDAELGGARGLYLGDAALHAKALYQALDVQVPKAFAAMPDHLALLLELLALYVRADNREAAAQLARDHFDWLDAYDEELANRQDRAADAPLFSAEARSRLVQGIAHLRALVALVATAVESLSSRETEREDD